MTTHRSYGIAGVLPDEIPAGMTINVSPPTHSTRTAHLDGERLLVVVGEGHVAGQVTDTAARWARLRDWARTHFQVTDVRYHWSTQDIATNDHVPFVGFITPTSKRVLVATGFNGWGMTNGTAAAILMRALILGESNQWAGTFDARRAELSLPGVTTLKQNAHIAYRWLNDRVVGPAKATPADLRPGEAAVMQVDGASTAAYRDNDGTLHQVSAVCTHLRCDVRWNAGEKSWDCPCHGSMVRR